MSAEPRYLRDLVARQPSAPEYLREAVAKLEQPTPSNDVQASYAEQRPRPVKKPHRKNQPGTVHANASVLIEIDGVTKNACAWSRERGWYGPKVSNRIATGWHPRAAVLGHSNEGKAEAHARLKLEPCFTCPTKGPVDRARAQPRPTQRTPKPSIVAGVAVSLPNATGPNGHMLSASEAEALGMQLIRLAGTLRGTP